MSQAVEQYLIQVEGQNLAIIDAVSQDDAVLIFRQRVHLGELEVPAHQAAAIITAVLKKQASKNLRFMYKSQETCWKCGHKVAIDDINMHLKVCKGKGKKRD